MIVFLFISAGLFLGWSLGAKDAPNIFGTAVVTKMVNFRMAAIVSGLFVILGSLLQGGGGGTETLQKLGSADALGGAFTIALCAGLTVFFFTKYKLPSSSSQAIVGAIIGWCFFSNTVVNQATLGIIVASWISAPVLAAIIAPLLYLLLRYFIRRSRLHIIKLDFYIRIVLVVVGAFAAYSLGANNIPNVTAVFISALPEIQLNLGVASLNSTTLVFFFGGVSIAAGIYMYGRKALGTGGVALVELTPESAIVVVFTQALTLFLFTSSTLANLLKSLDLPLLPLVPVSSSQAMFGAILGISLLKGVGEVKAKLLGNLLTGWILTPLVALVTTFFSLFIVQNVFKIVVSGKLTTVDAATLVSPTKDSVAINIPMTGNFTLLVVALSLIISISLLVFLQLKKHQLHFRIQTEKSRKESHYNEMQQALTDIEVKTVQLENTALSTRLQEKRNEVINYALSIGEQRKFLEMLAGKIGDSLREEESEKRNEILKVILTSLHQKMSFSHELDDLYLKAEKVHNDFPAKINEKFPDLTEQEKRLTILLRVGFSSKEISSIMNISPKSVEISRYRLRKKLEIDNKTNLTHFIKNI
jgi:phosphate/sulfate permease/DNA-binding CsgD family transcriptional regulator